MRTIVLILAVACASPAAAQDYRAQMDALDAQRSADVLAARRRDVEITNQLSTLDAQIRTEQALRDIQAVGRQSATPRFDPHAPPPVVIDTSQLASMPDKALAESNARVRAAAANRK